MRCCIFIFALLLTTSAFAQTDRGSITGTITDSTGAVVPNAPVEITNQATGAVYSGGASTTGNFTIASLPAGQYLLSVTVAGFKKYVRENIQVTVATDTRVDVALEIGAAEGYVSDTTKLKSPYMIELEAGIACIEAIHAARIRVAFNALGIKIPVVPSALISTSDRDSWVIKVDRAA